MDMVVNAAGTGIQAPSVRGNPHRPLAGAISQAVLEEIDYGVIVVSPSLHVQHCNEAARARLRGQEALRLSGEVLQAADCRDGQRLRDAVAGAAQRCLRSLITLSGGLALSVVPVGQALSQGEPAVLLLLSKREICARLSAYRFATDHRLTAAEMSVLAGLSMGEEPRQIARRHGVGMTTIRTQLQSIRSKTGARCIRSLVMHLATLPPLVSVLRG